MIATMIEIMTENGGVGEKETGIETGTEIAIALETKGSMDVTEIGKEIGKVGSVRDEIGTVAVGGAPPGVVVGVEIERIVMMLITARDMAAAASVLGDGMDLKMNQKRRKKRSRRRMMVQIIQTRRLQKPTGFEHHLV